MKQNDNQNTRSSNQYQGQVKGKRSIDHETRVDAGKKSAESRTHENRVESGKKTIETRGQESPSEAGRKFGQNLHANFNKRK